MPSSSTRSVVLMAAIIGATAVHFIRHNWSWSSLGDSHDALSALGIDASDLIPHGTAYEPLVFVDPEETPTPVDTILDTPTLTPSTGLVPAVKPLPFMTSNLSYMRVCSTKQGGYNIKATMIQGVLEDVDADRDELCFVDSTKCTVGFYYGGEPATKDLTRHVVTTAHDGHQLTCLRLKTSREQDDTTTTSYYQFDLSASRQGFCRMLVILLGGAFVVVLLIDTETSTAVSQAPVQHRLFASRPQQETQAWPSVFAFEREQLQRPRCQEALPLSPQGPFIHSASHNTSRYSHGSRQYAQVCYNHPSPLQQHLRVNYNLPDSNIGTSTWNSNNNGFESRNPMPRTSSSWSFMNASGYSL